MKIYTNKQTDICVCEATVCPPDVARGRVMCRRGFFFFFSALPCDRPPSANIIPTSTAPAHDDPILVLQAAFRVERVREREADIGEI